MRLGLFLAFILSGSQLAAQTASLFPERVIGTWTGVLRIFKDGTIRDSVNIQLTIKHGDQPNVWLWKTEYFSPKNPITKDYVLRLSDPATLSYILDEGGGITLSHFQFGDKLYGVFETGGILLTSTYELRAGELIFEVTSGRKIPGESEVSRYTMPHLQRAVLRRN